MVIIIMYIVLILLIFYYSNYALLWHVLYILVNIDQDQMKLELVNITGKQISIEESNN